MARRVHPKIKSNQPKPHSPGSPISGAQAGDAARRTKGRARTRASGVRIIKDPEHDEKRLKDQLTQMGLYATNTVGDGNCLFRALSDQVYGSPSEHFKIRTDIVDYLSRHQTRYQDFVDTEEVQSYQNHLQNMAQLGSYGGHLELNGFANLVRRQIKVIQPGMVYVIDYDHPPGPRPRSPEETCKGKHRSTDTQPPQPSSGVPIYIVYHHWEHYSSVRNIKGPHSGVPRIREISPYPQATEDSYSYVVADKETLAHPGGEPLQGPCADSKADFCPPRSSNLSPGSPSSSSSTSTSSPPSTPSFWSQPSFSSSKPHSVAPPLSSTTKPTHQTALTLSKRQVRLLNRKKPLSSQGRIRRKLQNHESSESPDPRGWNNSIETVGLFKELKV